MESKLNDLNQREKDKYARHHSQGYQRSACAIPLAFHIETIGRSTERLLEIGFGDGSTIRYLNSIGLKCRGVDITRNGLSGDVLGSVFDEAPVWEMPYQDNQFDLSFSTDVLEHIPEEMVDKAISEILRVTKDRSFHCVATFPHEIEGEQMHLTVNPIEWWRDRFEALNKKGLKIGLVDRTDFLSMLLAS